MYPLWIFLILGCLFSYTFATELKTGDLIFRQEKSFISKLFAQIEQADYAHVGIVLHSDQDYVVHSEMAEDVDGLRVQKLNDFLKDAEKWMVLRSLSTYDEKKLQTTIEKYIRLKPTFNTTLTTSDENKFYCTELIDVIYKEALGIDIALSKSFLSGKEYISTKDIYSNPLFTLIYKSYEEKL